MSVSMGTVYNIESSEKHESDSLYAYTWSDKADSDSGQWGDIKVNGVFLKP